MFNPIREAPTVAKYLRSMWLWVTPVSGVYWVKYRRSLKRRGKPISVKPRVVGGGGSWECRLPLFPALRLEKEKKNVLFLVIAVFL